MTAAAAADAATLNVSQLWRGALGELELQMTKATFNTWLKDTAVVAFEGDTLVIEVRDEYAVEWLENRLYGAICRTLRAIADRPELDVRFQVGDKTAPVVPLAVGSRPPDLIVSAGANGHSNGRVNGTAVERVEDEAVGDEEPGPPPARVARPGGGNVQIEIHASEPNFGFVAIPHYAQRFWRPFLGLIPFTLWEVLRSYAYFVDRYDQSWPTIESLCSSLGYGTRATLIGRAARGKNPAQRGAVDILSEHRIIHYWTEGEARLTRYFFQVRETLPVLTPYQVSKLPPVKQREHEQFLAYHREFDIDQWRETDLETLVPDKWWERRL